MKTLKMQEMVLCTSLLLSITNQSFGDESTMYSSKDFLTVSVGRASSENSGEFGISYINREKLDWLISARIGREPHSPRRMHDSVFAFVIAPGRVVSRGKMDLGLFAGPAFATDSRSWLIRHSDEKGGPRLAFVIQPHISYQLFDGFGIGMQFESLIGNNINQHFLCASLHLGGNRS